MEVRRTLLSPEDRAAAEGIAALLGVSDSELIEEFENLSPEQQAAFEMLVDQANAIVPELRASLDRMEPGIARCRKSIREMSASTAAMSDRVSAIEESLGLIPTG